MPIYINVAVFVLACGIASCLIAMLVLASQGEKRLDIKRLPPVETRALLNKRESVLREDLNAVCEKLGLQAFTKVGLGVLFQTRDELAREKWREVLMTYHVDFVLCDPRTGKPLMAILPVEQGATLEHRQSVVIRTLDKTDIPYIQLGNYNRAGLEKVIKEKLDNTLPASPETERARLEQSNAPEPAAVEG